MMRQPLIQVEREIWMGDSNSKKLATLFWYTVDGHKITMPEAFRITEAVRRAGKKHRLQNPGDWNVLAHLGPFFHSAESPITIFRYSSY